MYKIHRFVIFSNYNVKQLWNKPCNHVFYPSAQNCQVSVYAGGAGGARGGGGGGGAAFSSDCTLIIHLEVNWYMRIIDFNKLKNKHNSRGTSIFTSI